MPTVVHFDISADNTGRAKKFYEQLFGWKINRIPGPTGYYLIETNDLNGDVGVGGGMATREEPGQGIVNFFGVPSVDEYLTRVEKLGGRIIESKQPVPGYGYMAVCLDTESNPIGLWEDDSDAK